MVRLWPAKSAALLLPNLLDICVVILLNLMFLPDMSHEALWALEERVFGSATGTEWAGVATTVAMALDDKTVPDQKGLFFNNFFVVFFSLNSVMHDIFGDLPGSTWLNVKCRPARWALIATILAECVVKHHPVVALKILTVYTEQWAIRIKNRTRLLDETH